MKKILTTVFCFALCANIFAQENPNADLEKKAAGWVASLSLNDAAKEQRLTNVITTHLAAVRDFHNAHPYTEVPEGINPTTGNKMSKVERYIIVESTQPKETHEALMSGLRADLSEEQVELVLDKYTVGKVAFTLQGYKAIIPDLTADEEAQILKLLKQAREQAVDYKNMELISGIFEIYKTKCELYLYQNDRNWKALFKAYVDKRNAEKKKK